MEETIHSRSAISYTSAYIFRKVYTLCLVIFIANTLFVSSSSASTNLSLIPLSIESQKANNITNWPFLESYMPPPPPPPCDLALLTMNEGSGSLVADSYGNLPDNTIIGATWTTRPNGGNALSFDGVGDYINLGDDANLNIAGDMTIAMWINPDNFTNRQNPWAKAYGGEGTITLEQNGSLNFYWGTGGGNATPYTSIGSGYNLSVNTWTHIAIVRDVTNGVAKWYVNGVETSSKITSMLGSVSSLPAYIGRGYVSDLAGDLDDVQVFDCALNATEVADLLVTQEICGNGIDDDGDGLVDGADPDCGSHWMEAECAEIGANWNIVSDVTASNGSYVTIQTGNTSNTTAPTGVDDRVRYNVTVTNAGNYNVFGRVQGATSDDDSFWVRANGGTWYKWNSISQFAPTSFEWSQVYDSDNGNALISFPLVAGLNTIDFAYREDGSLLDKVMVGLTSTIPTGTGESSTNCTPNAGFDNEVCYLISDGNESGSVTPDTFYTFNYITSTVTPIGPTGTLKIESMAMDTVNKIIYAISGDEFGTINVSSGLFSAIAADVGSLNGSEGILNINDVDGMTFDHANNIIWATERRTLSDNIDGAPDDLLIKIDPISGLAVQDAFGSGVGYFVVNTPENDLDDIAIAEDGTLYAISNFGGSGNQAFGSINKTTGVWTDLGDYGIRDVESLAFTATGQLVATTGKDGSDDSNKLYTIDAGTGIATYVGSVLPGHDVEACDCMSAKLINLQIGDKVFADIDSDGIQGLEEPGVPNVVVNLLTSAGNPYLNDLGAATTTTTDAFGIYNFDGLSEGQYMVEFILPGGGESFTTQDTGGDDELDSDANTSTGRSHVITLANSTNDLSIDAGLLNTNAVVRDCNDYGELFVIDGGGSIKRFDQTTGALIGDFITGLSGPIEMIVGSDDWLYVSNRIEDEVRKYSLKTGVLIDIITGDLRDPHGMTIGPDGNIYVNNDDYDEVIKIDIATGTTSKFTVSAAGGLNGNKWGIEFGPDGNLYVASYYSDEILRYNGTTGAFMDVFVAANSSILNAPSDLTFGPDGHLYVTGKYNDKVVKYNGTTGAYMSDFVSYQSGGLQDPVHLQFGEDGFLYVSSQSNSIGVLKYNGTTGGIVGNFAYTAAPEGILFAPVPGCTGPCYNDITVSNVSVSSCIDHPLRDVATVTMDIAWSNPPTNEHIDVTIGNKTEIIDVPAGATSPYTLTFNVIADGSLNNVISASWETTTGCDDAAFFNSPGSCSNDEIGCDILYLCGLDKPYDGEPFDHGWIEYLDDINGTNNVTPILTKDEAGMGTYDPMNTSTFINVNLADYDLIIISATTEGHFSSDLVNAVKDFPSGLLNGNYLLTDDLGLSLSNGGVTYGTSAYIDNTTQEEIYNYDNPGSWSGKLFTNADYESYGDGYLWGQANGMTSRNDGISVHFEASDALPGVSNAHGSRVSFGYHMNGLYANGDNNGILPSPASAWFTPENHLTLIGKEKLDEAILLAADGCCPNIPVSVTGPTSICEGFTSQLSPTTGGTWSSNNSGIATVTNGGLVTGVSPGSTTFIFTNSTTLCTSDATQPITVNGIPTVNITGPNSICEGEFTTLTPTSGGTWTSSNNAVATITNTGIVSGISGGTATFTFTDNTTLCVSPASAPVTIKAKTPVSVTGPTSICEGFTSQLSPTSGGTWTSNNTAIATVTNGGLVTGISAGSTTFVFTNNTNNCASDATQPITVNDIPTVEITGATLLCVGSSTTLMPNSGGTWTSSNTAVATVTNSGIATAVGDGTATFTFTTSQGCVTGSTETLTVDPGGHTTITGDDIICEGETTQLSASTGGGTWLTSDASIATINSSGLVTAISAGSVTITYDKNSSSCQADATFGIMILDGPTVTILGATTLCVGENTQLSTDGSGGFWSSSDSDIAIISSDGIVAGISGGTVTFTYTNPNGCESSASGTITIDPAVEIAIDFNGSQCLENDSQLSAIVTGGTAAFTYAWTGPNSFTGNTQTIDISINGNYNLTVTDSQGCSSNTTAFIYEQYEPFIFTLNSEVCEGETVTLSVNGASGGTYQWDADANNATTSSVTVTPGLPSTSYTVTVTNSVGCTTSATAVIDVIARPTVSITGPDNICVGGTTQLSPSSGGIWTSSDYSVANVSNTGLVSGTGAGSATFTFKDDVTGCYSDPTTIVTVNDNIDVTVSGDDQICMGDNPTLTASITGGTWSSDNTSIANIHSSTGVITPVAQGSAVILYTSPATGCYNNTTYNINIYNDPSLALNGPSTICEGSVTYVSASTSGTWTSSDVSVAVVSNTGEVTGVGPGSATFSFVSVVGCTAVLGTPITVVANPVISITGPSDICVNETTTLSPTSGGVWISSNNSIATVNSSGVVTGKSAGNASFTYIESTYGCVSENNVTVTVNAAPNITAPSTNSLCIGETASITPNSGGTWTSSNPTIASIANNGTITAISGGSATFMYSSNLTGCTSAASTPVTVQPSPTISFSGPTSICQDETTSVQPSVGGFWSSTDVSIATITNQGIITGESPGTVQFIFTNTNSGCVSDSSEVLTIKQPTLVSVSGPTNICVGFTTSLSPNTGGAWSSSNTSVATVTNSGIVTGVSPGTVTFIFQDGSGCSSEPTEGITIDATPNSTFLGSSSICIGDVTTLSPSSGGTWTSSNTGIATITNSGVATAISAGSVTLTYTNSSTGCVADADADLTVNAPPTINLIGGNEICIGGTTNLSPSTGGSWISSDNSVASISANGTVTGISAGDVTFTFVKSSTGCTSEDSEPITVLPKPVVTIDGSNTICVGSTTTLSPSTGGTWISSNIAVATVTNGGVVTGVSQGLAKFTFTSTQGCASSKTAPVIVFDQPSVIIDGPNSICIGDMAQMLPSNGGTWESTNPAIATIDNSGLVTAVTSGVTTFTFTDTNTGCISDPSEPLTIVGKPVTSLSGPSEICIGGTTNMTPASGGIWSSLHPQIASIQNNGEITGISAGEAKFIFMSLSTGCYSDTTTAITVLSGPDIQFNGPTEICIGDTTYILPSSGGTWESTNLSIATISNSGMIIGIGAGSVRFQYTETSSNCKSEMSEFLTVNGAPTVGIAGPATICLNAVTNLYPSSGGTWESLNPAIATVDASGIVTGISEGTAYFEFTDTYTGCKTDGSLSIDVQASPEIEIIGSNKVCLGYTTALSPSISGIWTSSNPAIASVSNSGVVTGLAPGVVTFQFMDPVSGCTSNGASDPITIVNCTNHDFNVTLKDEIVYGDLNTNDKINGGVSYGGVIETISKPLASIPSLTVNSDGTYSFEGSKAGKYIFRVPICMLPIVDGCEGTLLEINVVDNVYSQQNPVSNLEFTTTYRGALSSDSGIMVVIDAIANDTCIYGGGCSIDETSLGLIGTPNNGTATINNNYKIEYTPNPNFVGLDTIDYTVCLDDGITCSQSQEIVIVNDISAMNSTVANDDFYFTMRESVVSGNIIQNDHDPEDELISVVAVGSELNPVVIPEGSYFINNNGDFTFTPADDFMGTANIVYTLCDNLFEPYCAQATIHLLVLNDLSLNIRVYLEGALMSNSGAETQGGLPLMRDDLRISPFTGINYIPTTDPYTIGNDPFFNTQDQFTQVGSGLIGKNQLITDSLGVFSVNGDNAIVDWVHVEMRSKSDNTLVIATRSGLVQRDGDVVDLDGTSSLRFQGINVDSFYVVVKHRSHLGVMSLLVNSETVIDFTDPNFPVFNYGTTYGNGFDYSGLSRKNSVVYGYSALWAGDFDANGKVKFTNPEDDQNILFLGVLFSSPEFLINYDNAYGYLTSDFDMNSKSKYTNPKDDLNFLFSQILLYPLNDSFLSNFSSLIEQIPE